MDAVKEPIRNNGAKGSDNKNSINTLHPPPYQGAESRGGSALWRPDIWTCIPQAQEPLAIPVWAVLATDTNARAVVSHTSLVVWDSFSLPASLPKQTFSMATKDSANSPLK